MAPWMDSSTASEESIGLSARAQTKDLRGKKDDKVEEDEMGKKSGSKSVGTVETYDAVISEFDRESGEGKATHPLTKECSDEEDKLEVGSSKHSSFFTSTSSSDSDLPTTDGSSDRDLDHSPDKGATVDRGGSDYSPHTDGLDYSDVVAKGGSDLLLHANNEDDSCYFGVPPKEPEVQDNSWIRDIALDIKLHSQIFRCESIEELKEFKATMKANGQNTDLLGRRRSLLEDLEYRILWKYRMMKELFAFVPFIEGKCYSIEEVEALLVAAKDYCIEKKLVSKEWFENDGEAPLWKFYNIVQMCGRMLKEVEGDKFHPLIREGYMNDLQKLISLYERSCRVNELQFITLNPRQFMTEDCLARRVVDMFFDVKIKADKNYVKANEKVSLLRMFESHIALVDFDEILEEMNIDLKKEDFNLEEEAEKLVKNGVVVPEKYNSLDEDLIKQSLKERLFFAKMIVQLGYYGTFLLDLIEEKDEKGANETRMDLLIRSSGGARFFDCSKKYKEEAGRINHSIWEEKEVCDFIEAVGKEAFPDLPKQYVVRGILDYNDYLEVQEKGEDFRKEYREEFSSLIWRQLYLLEEYWSTTRFLDHEVYKNAMLTERIDWGELDDIEKSLNDILGKMKLS